MRRFQTFPPSAGTGRTESCHSPRARYRRHVTPNPTSAELRVSGSALARSTAEGRTPRLSAPMGK